MMPVVLISILGASILFLSIRLLAQSNTGKGALVTVQDYATARETLDSVFVETAAVKRIFSMEDAEFIGRSAPAHIRSLFFKERKKLALQWLRNIAKQVARLMDLHLRLASYTDDPSPRFELMLTAKYLAFIVVCHVSSALLWVFGPAKLTYISSYTIHTAADFCTTFSLRLQRVNPTRLSSSLVH